MKIAGCILLFFGCCLMGYMKAFTYKSRVKELENVIEIIKLIEVEITYRKESIKKVFKRVSGVKNSWFSNVLGECEKNLEDNESFDKAWKNSIKNQDKCPLNSSDIEILNDLAAAIGRSDAEGQSKMIVPVVIRLNRNLESAKSSYRNQGKMYKGIGVASGATLMILLL